MKKYTFLQFCSIFSTCFTQTVDFNNQPIYSILPVQNKNSKDLFLTGLNQSIALTSVENDGKTRFLSYLTWELDEKTRRDCQLTIQSYNKDCYNFVRFLRKSSDSNDDNVYQACGTFGTKTSCRHFTILSNRLLLWHQPTDHQIKSEIPSSMLPKIHNDQFIFDQNGRFLFLVQRHKYSDLDRLYLNDLYSGNRFLLHETKMESNLKIHKFLAEEKLLFFSENENSYVVVLGANTNTNSNFNKFTIFCNGNNNNVTYNNVVDVGDAIKHQIPILFKLDGEIQNLFSSTWVCLFDVQDIDSHSNEYGSENSENSNQISSDYILLEHNFIRSDENSFEMTSLANDQSNLYLINSLNQTFHYHMDLSPNKLYLIDTEKIDMAGKYFSPNYIQMETRMVKNPYTTNMEKICLNYQNCMEKCQAHPNCFYDFGLLSCVPNDESNHDSQKLTQNLSSIECRYFPVDNFEADKENDHNNKEESEMSTNWYQMEVLDIESEYEILRNKNREQLKKLQISTILETSDHNEHHDDQPNNNFEENLSIYFSKIPDKFLLPIMIGSVIFAVIIFIWILCCLFSKITCCKKSSGKKHKNVNEDEYDTVETESENCLYSSANNTVTCYNNSNQDFVLGPGNGKLSNLGPQSTLNYKIEDIYGLKTSTLNKATLPNKQRKTSSYNISTLDRDKHAMTLPHDLSKFSLIAPIGADTLNRTRNELKPVVENKYREREIM